MNIPSRHALTFIAWIIQGTMQQGYCRESGPSIFGETTVSGIRDWFGKPRNSQLFDGKHRPDPSSLKYWTKSDLDWPCLNYVSPDGSHVFCIQKTGSGDNSATLFRRTSRGKITQEGNWTAEREFSDGAWAFFRERTGLAAVVYHAGVEFVAWGDDRQCVEFSLSGTDCYENYHVRDWVLHYNFTTRRFFVATGQKNQNRKAVVFRNPTDESS